MLALVSDLWGGPALSIADGTALLQGAGFSAPRPLPPPPGAPAILVAQR